MFGPKREEMRRCQTITQLLHNNLYRSQNMITIMKSRRMEGTVNVASVEALRYAHIILVRKPEKKSSLERCWRNGSVI